MSKGLRVPRLSRTGFLRRGFTLIELMLVIALMGIMGTLAVGGYSAVTRGMSERAALATARSLAEAALQRAQIDQAQTYVFLFDEVLRPDTDTSVGVVQGVAIAVRACGRVTEVADGLVCDEFGDLERSFKSLVDEDDSETESEEKQKAAVSTMRIYNLRSRDSAEVEEGVRSYVVTDTDLEEDGDKDKETAVRWKVYGFKKVSGADFKVGDAYGQEFAVTRLPPGYTFSSSVSMSSSSDIGQKSAGAVTVVRPGDSSAPSLTVYARRPNGSFESIGSTGSVKDTAKQ